jgi:Reverse transcriptase (RNA-dependent DNA polymerase)
VTISNGTRQGGVLSPYLLTLYIRDLLSEIESSKIGCNLGGMFINVLAYADDMVLLAPSWRAMEMLLATLVSHITKIDMICNSNKTVCMVFNHLDRNKVVSRMFPPFTPGTTKLQYVDEFKYLGHIIFNDFSDDCDISREICNMFVRTNIRRFSRCYEDVKVALFKTDCICIYDPAFRKHYTQSSLNRLMSCYNKFIKIFFGYKRRDSMTQILVNLGLPHFNTVINNSNAAFYRSHHLSDIWLLALI